MQEKCGDIWFLSVVRKFQDSYELPLLTIIALNVSAMQLSIFIKL